MKKRIDKTNYIFYFAYIMFLLSFTIETSFFSIYIAGIKSVTRYFSMALLVVVEIIKQKMNKRSIYASIVFALLMLTSTLFANDRKIVYLLMFVIVGRNIRFEKIAKITIVVETIFMLIVIISSQLGIIEDYISYRSSGIARHYLGFLYALYGPALLLNIIMLYTYVKKDSIRVWEVVIWTIFAYAIYRYTDSRLSFVLTELVLIFSLIYKYGSRILNKKRALWMIACTAFVVCAFASIYITINYNEHDIYYRKLNDIMAGRLYYGQKGYLKYGFSLLGQKVTWVGNGLSSLGVQSNEEYLYVDNLYLQLLIRYGALFLLVYIGINTLVCIWAYKRHEYWVVFVLVLLAVHSMIDDNGLSLAYNSFWFLISSWLISPGKKHLNQKRIVLKKLNDNWNLGSMVVQTNLNKVE